jgi:hypothetical protein
VKPVSGKARNVEFVLHTARQAPRQEGLPWSDRTAPLCHGSAQGAELDTAVVLRIRDVQVALPVSGRRLLAGRRCQGRTHPIASATRHGDFSIRLLPVSAT